MINNQEMYSSDSPVSNESQDQFNRFPFARRVANVISKRKDPNSIVIGIYGAWGEGKTSVFNFIEGELNKQEHVVCIRFNPWRYGKEEHMLANFFNDLATSIDRSIETGRERVGGFIKKFLKPVASIFGKGEIADGVSSFFKTADIVELKERIESVLEEEKKRVVILIDDIDRLEKNEIHAVFRLVKLTADFKYTAYVLAFDKEMVAAALQERYGSGNINAGRAFLEKIIQVPLQLPIIDSNDLRNFCLKGVENALESAEIELTEEQAQLFVNNFTCIEKQLKTPRQAMLYSNILTFSLPILKGEVNPVDLMLIEGLRVFSSDVYDFIRENKNKFMINPSMRYRSDNEEEKRRKEEIEAILKDYSFDIKEEIKRVLCFLFPALNAVFGNIRYGSEWEKSWNENQRVCADKYFERYFSYSIPKEDISDQGIKKLLLLTERMSSDEIKQEIDGILDARNAKVFISKLRDRAKSLSQNQAETLAMAISKLGNNLPNPRQFLTPMNPYSQGAILIGELIESVNDKNDQINLAIKVIDNAIPLHFAAECFTWLVRDTKEYPNPRGFLIQDLRKIGRELASRISLAFKTENILEDETHAKKLPSLCYFWTEYGEKNEAQDFIKNKLDEHPGFALELIKQYVPTAWGPDGVPKKSDFNRMQYDSIIKIIEPEHLLVAIEKQLGEIKLEKDFPRTSEGSLEEKIARQFAWIHNYVVSEQKTN
ncbi:KAP family P-loop NTPase fold protein [Sporolactobacillus pectinivorans]|uniref:KAP family P-loop NTPase fold protein n=1 Tax=Sporolactobacillus pectinivorans TaxID=1591408 RepID=UPI000C2675BE|nr:KAP family NTPase [Sporolactobacillus pectinivorans]